MSPQPPAAARHPVRAGPCSPGCPCRSRRPPPRSSTRRVAGYTLTVTNRQDRVRRLPWVTAYIDALTAYPASQTVTPVTRGNLYTLYGLLGTARVGGVAVVPAAPDGRHADHGHRDRGRELHRPGRHRVAEGRGDRRRRRRAPARPRPGSAAAAAAPSTPARTSSPARPAQVIPYNVGAGGTAGASPVDGQPPCSGPARPGRWSFTANGGKSAAQNSITGALGRPGITNSVTFPGGAGRTASGSVGGGGGSSGGTPQPGRPRWAPRPTVFTASGDGERGRARRASPRSTRNAGAPAGPAARARPAGNGGGGGGGEYAAAFVAVTPGTCTT